MSYSCKSSAVKQGFGEYLFTLDLWFQNLSVSPETSFFYFLSFFLWANNAFLFVVIHCWVQRTHSLG